MTHFAREYGNALFELATEEGVAQEMEQQLQLIVACFREQPEYIALLDARNIEIEKRKALLDEAFSGHVHAYLLNYLKLLTERGAMRLFTECADFFRMRYNEAYGIAEASVTSASALDEAQQAALKAKLEELRAGLEADGGDVELVKIDGKVVYVKLVGHCGSCPFAMMTLKQGIEVGLQEIDPEITVERVEA